MRKVHKYLTVFSLWIVGIIILSHVAIPHHHHFDSITSHQNYKDQTTSTHDGNREDSPLHCHGLNDISTDRFESYRIELQNVPITDLILNTNTEPTLHLYSLSNNINYSTYNISFSGQYFLSCTPFRGPPSLV